MSKKYIVIGINWKAKFINYFDSKDEMLDAQRLARKQKATNTNLDEVRVIEKD